LVWMGLYLLGYHRHIDMMEELPWIVKNSILLNKLFNPANNYYKFVVSTNSWWLPALVIVLFSKT
jgi:hypothetical protein